MKISQNFNLSEFTKTTTGLPNEPDGIRIEAIKNLVINLLQPARDQLGLPIVVTSGFRSLEVNTKVGGSAKSQHTMGEAADLKCTDNKKLFDILSHMEFDQLIWEFGTDNYPAWVHVSFRKGYNRKQILRAHIGVSGKTTYMPIRKYF